MRGGSFELPPFTHRGTMLIEVILVLAITLAISGAVVTRFRPLSVLGSPEQQAHKEAERLALWFESRLCKGRLQQHSCEIRLLPGDRPVDQVRITWDTGEREIFDSRGKAWFQMASFNRVCTYSPRWHTVSPAFALEVKTAPQSGETVCSVVVSLHSFISIK